jgi:hypothetical protein
MFTESLISNRSIRHNIVLHVSCVRTFSRIPTTLKTGCPPGKHTAPHLRNHVSARDYMASNVMIISEYVIIWNILYRDGGTCRVTDYAT